MATFSEKSSKSQTEDQRTQKTELILSPIHQIKLRLGGYSIWSASTSLTIYIDSRLENLIASMQPKKHSKDYSKQSVDSENGRLAPDALKTLDYADESP